MDKEDDGQKNDSQRDKSPGDESQRDDSQGDDCQGDNGQGDVGQGDDNQENEDQGDANPEDPKVHGKSHNLCRKQKVNKEKMQTCEPATRPKTFVTTCRTCQSYLHGSYINFIKKMTE